MHRLGNRIRREFLECLLVLHERKLYHALGFSSTFYYAAHTFGIERSETYDSLRVARALKGLPRSLEAFDRGELSWSALKEVSRVATAASEQEWLACAREQPVRRLQAEVGE
ncbi:MAG: hypothetical protein O7J95_19320, partial [Planctomycetota bacterium]|nr:hypothetical protein [Planctomycetota bacterium]